MRVHELAKTLNLTSKELLVKLKALRISAKASTSTLDADAVNRARKALTSRPPAKKAPSAAAKTATSRSVTKTKAAAQQPGRRPACGRARYFGRRS